MYTEFFRYLEKITALPVLATLTKPNHKLTCIEVKIMANAYFITVSRDTISLLDEISYLADSYEALQHLAFAEYGDSSPIGTVLSSLNKQFDLYLAALADKGLLS